MNKKELETLYNLLSDFENDYICELEHIEGVHLREFQAVVLKYRNL